MITKYIRMVKPFDVVIIFPPYCFVFFTDGYLCSPTDE